MLGDSIGVGKWSIDNIDPPFCRRIDIDIIDTDTVTTNNTETWGTIHHFSVNPSHSPGNEAVSVFNATEKCRTICRGRNHNTSTVLSQVGDTDLVDPFDE
jgi:hypothetical protein